METILLSVILIIAFLLLWWRLLSRFVKKGRIRQLELKSHHLVDVLEQRVSNTEHIGDSELYQTWLNESNPEMLRLGILMHHENNKKVYDTLSAKLLLVCNTMERILKIDNAIDTLVSVNSNIPTVSEIAKERETLLRTINRNVSEIKSVLHSSDN